MPEKHLFEYAIIRVVPRVERGEFMNIGVVLYCAGLKFLNTTCHIDEKRLRAFSTDVEPAALHEYMDAYSEICKGSPAGGPIGALPIAERFRWLTATRSTIIQTSPVHTGLTDDAREMLDRLFGQLVLQPT